MMDYLNYVKGYEKTPILILGWTVPQAGSPRLYKHKEIPWQPKASITLFWLGMGEK